MNSKVYKCCAVPKCHSTSIKTPNKVFIFVSRNKTIRNKWLRLARRDAKDISPNYVLYFCEDHFDLPNDMENYMEYHVMGSVSQVRMKPGCIPTKFKCQPDRRKRTSTTTKRPYILKKQRRTVIEECEKDIEERKARYRREGGKPGRPMGRKTAADKRIGIIHQQKRETMAINNEIGYNIIGKPETNYDIETVKSEESSTSSVFQSDISDFMAEEIKIEYTEIDYHSDNEKKQILEQGTYRVKSETDDFRVKSEESSASSLFQSDISDFMTEEIKIEN